MSYQWLLKPSELLPEKPPPKPYQKIIRIFFMESLIKKDIQSSLYFSLNYLDNVIKYMHEDDKLMINIPFYFFYNRFYLPDVLKILNNKIRILLTIETKYDLVFLLKKSEYFDGINIDYPCLGFETDLSIPEILFNYMFIYGNDDISFYNNVKGGYIDSPKLKKLFKDIINVSTYMFENGDDDYKLFVVNEYNDDEIINFFLINCNKKFEKKQNCWNIIVDQIKNNLI